MHLEKDTIFSKFAHLCPIYSVSSVKMHPNQDPLVLIHSHPSIIVSWASHGFLISSCRSGVTIFVLEVKMK